MPAHSGCDQREYTNHQAANLDPYPVPYPVHCYLYLLYLLYPLYLLYLLYLPSLYPPLHLPPSALYLVPLDWEPVALVLHLILIYPVHLYLYLLYLLYPLPPSPFYLLLALPLALLYLLLGLLYLIPLCLLYLLLLDVYPPRSIPPSTFFPQPST